MKNYFTPLKIRIVLFLSAIISILNSASAQTWVRTPYFEIYGSMTVNYDSLHVGPLEICKTPNGKIFTLMQIDQDEEVRLYIIDSTGNFLLNRNTSHSGGIYTENSFSLHPTSDNGCVYAFDHIDIPMVDFKVFRLNSNGIVLWSKDYNTNGGQPILVQEIIPTYYNTFYLQFSDSLVELNAGGSFIRNRFPFTGKIIALPDSEFILFDSSIVSRQDFPGNVTWSMNPGASYLVLVHADTTSIFMDNATRIIKINANNGSVAWNKSIPHSKMSITEDGGIIAVGGAGGNDQVARYDSSGTLIWSRIIPFPSFGYTNIIESKPDKYILGGGFKSTFLDMSSFLGGVSSFLFSIDSTGHGEIDSTDFYFNGNANDNHMESFADDACYIAAALNDSGPARDLAFAGLSFCSVFGKDWPGGFPCGFNYKYSDCDGNGIIDTADIDHMILLNPGGEYSSPHWLRVNHNSTLPDLIISYREDSLNAGDTATVDVILGSPLNPVDSIYALSLSIPVNYNFSNGTDTVPASNFGNPALNLYSYFSFYNWSTNFVISRQDHHNTSVYGDTIASFHYIINGTQGFNTPWVQYNAITKDGCSIPLNLVLDSIFVINTTGITNPLNSHINIFPNSANNVVYINSGNEKINQLLITENTGRIIFKSENTNVHFQINTSDFPDGIYNVTGISGNAVFNSKFIVIH